MNLRFHIIGVLLAFVCRLNSSPGDSLIKLSELDFKNEFERETFVNYQRQTYKDNLTDLFLTTWSGQTSVNRARAKEQINDAVAYLQKETKGMTEDKRVKTIYRYVQQRFLKKYQLQNSFPNIFESGQFNCVSGSAMYALIFTKMNIPFQVIEAPQHVYLMAYPSSYKIAIESTSPTNGYMVFKESYIKRFVSYLYYKKLVGEEEYKNKNAEVLFERYYFYKKGLTLLDLAGIQYCNYSVYYYEDEEQKSALEEIKKSYYLWPCEKNKHLLEWLLISVCGKAEYNQERDVAHLEMLCRINNGVGENVSNDRIKYEFSRLMKTQLTNNSDYAGFDKSYGLIYAAINDSILKSEISFAYHYELARLGYLNFKNKNYETDHLNKAYAINPKHADLRTIIKAYLGRLIEKTQDPANISKYLDEFTGAYSFLNDDSDFNNLRADCLLEQAYQYLAINQIAKGEKFLEEFENLCRQKPETKPTDRFVEKAYATAAAYYYKKGNVTKTKETLKRGMTYAPENFGLQMRLSQAH